MSTATIARAEKPASQDNPIKITIVSDFICPWCLIGHERLKAALVGTDAELVWLPFELNPDMPVEGLNRRDYRSAKFGSWERSQALDQGTVEAGASDGVTFNYDEIERTPNTFNAHRLSWLAANAGRQTDMVVALLEAYFQQGRDIGDIDTLTKVASEVGFDQDEVLRFLLSEDGVNEVRQLEARTRNKVRAVPHIVIGEAVIQGAEPKPVFRAAIERANVS